MNNYILTLDSSVITRELLINQKTYYYVETNNNYLHPYVFKNQDITEQPIIYVDTHTTGTYYNYWLGPNDDPDDPENPSTAAGLVVAYWEIKAYGIATHDEAKEIGELQIIWPDNQCIISANVNDFGCQIKDEADPYENNLCVKYVDLEKITLPDNVIIELHFSNTLTSDANIGWVESNGSSRKAEDINTFTILVNCDAAGNIFDNKIILDDNYEKSHVMFEGFRGKQSGSTSVYYATLLSITTFYYKSYDGSTPYNLYSANIYLFSGTGSSNVPIIDHDGVETGMTLTNGDKQCDSQFTLSTNDLLFIKDKCLTSGNFNGSGTSTDPYQVYIYYTKGYTPIS